MANAGRVTRDGPWVLRPSTPHSPSIHAFLAALPGAGFKGAPVPVDIGDDGRERLRFIEGEVALPPYPPWSQSDTALASVATLLLEFHRSSRSYAPDGSSWSLEMADPDGGSIVCHNDVCLENVVFRDGVAVGLLDFDFAAPGRPVYDLAQMARMCVPIDDDLARPDSAGRCPTGPPDSVWSPMPTASGGKSAPNSSGSWRSPWNEVASSSVAVWNGVTRNSSGCWRRWGAWSAMSAVVAGGGRRSRPSSPRWRSPGSARVPRTICGPPYWTGARSR